MSDGFNVTPNSILRRMAIRLGGRARPGTVGAEMERMMKALANPDPSKCAFVSFLHEIPRALNIVVPVIDKLKLVMIDATHFPDTTGIVGGCGSLSISALGGEFMAISLRYLQNNSGMSLPQLVTGPLRIIFEWLASESIMVLVNGTEGFQAFLRETGQENAPQNDVIDLTATLRNQMQKRRR